MQDPNNPNTTNTNAFPIPPNDAPATFSGSTQSVPPTTSQPPVVVSQPEPQQPETITPEVPVSVPVVPLEPVQPEPVAPVQPQPPVEPVIPAPQVEPIAPPSEPLQPNRFDIPPVPTMPAPEPVIPPPSPVTSSPISPINPEPIMPVMNPPVQPVVPEPIAQAVPPTPIYKPENIPSVSAPVASILTPAPAMPVVPLQQGVPAASVAPAFKKKSAFPKIALIAVAILLVISGILFAIMQFAGTGGGGTVGTKGEITWWGVTLDDKDVEPLIEDYKTSHPDVKITYVKQSKEEYRERLTNALAKGAGAPDIFEMHNSWQPMFKNDLATLPSGIMTPDEYKGTFYSVIATDMTTSKGIVGIPLYYDALTLYVNEDLFSVALKTAPKTWIDVQNLANPQTGITQKDKDGKIIQSAIALGTTDNVEYWSDIVGLMMYQNKASFTNFDAQQTKDTLAFYKYFGATTGNWDSSLPKSTEAFAKGKTAMIIAPASSAYDIIQSAPALHFKTYNLPQLPKENPSDPDVSYATYWPEGVWAKSASRDSAWEFLKYASSGQALQKINQSLKANSKPQRAYPIQSLNQQFTNDPILGSVVALAPVAKSWYLADHTNDGKTGLNTQLANAYALAFSNDTKTAQTDVLKILNQYGIPVPK